MSNGQVLENVVNLSISAVNVGVSAVQILSGTREVQSAATSMASAIEELSASVAEIEQTANRTSETVSVSSRLTHEGTQELIQLSQGVATTDRVFDLVAEKTTNLQKVVSNLGDVVELITKIAKQTNLLALNATIEAARAGQHGKGFAVVASEVKSLSRQTSEATEQIRLQIGELNNSFSDVLNSVSSARSNVQEVVEKADRVSADFRKINENSDAITTQVGELASVIAQQRTAISLMAENMATVVDKGADNLKSVDRLADQADRSVAIIEKWRSSLAEQDIPNKVILLAQADHMLWKKRLLDMAIGRSSLKVSDLTDHTACRLGKWYYQQNDSVLKKLPAFADIELPHKKVHQFGIEAAKCFENKKITEGMSHYMQLESASEEVVRNLKLLAAGISANGN